MLNLFPGGSQVSERSGQPFGVPTSGQVQSYLAQVEPLFPGTTAAYSGVFGAGSTPGSIHFAGEHTSTSYVGVLDGAVESGERVAKAVALS